MFLSDLFDLFLVRFIGTFGGPAIIGDDHPWLHTPGLFGGPAIIGDDRH